MEPLSNLLAVMALVGSVSLLTPDTANRVSFAPGEIFLPPAAAPYQKGWTIGYYEAADNSSMDEDGLIMNIANGFSLQRFYLSDTRILEVGGYASAHNYFKQTDEELFLARTDAVVGMNIGYLVGNMVTKLIWEYEYHSSSHHPQKDRNFQGDSAQILLGDLRKSLRYYLVYGEFQHTSFRQKNFARYGFDYRSPAADRGRHFILGAEQRSYAINDGAVTNIVRLGMEKSHDPLNAWRVMGEWKSRERDYGPYLYADRSVSSIRFQRLF